MEIKKMQKYFKDLHWCQIKKKLIILLSIWGHLVSPIFSLLLLELNAK
jgi:hypothetical protein